MVNGLEFFQRKEIKDILSYLHLLNNPQDGVALRRVINTPPRGIGKTTIDRLADYADRHGLPLLEAARQAGRIESIKARPAALVAKFVVLFDRLSAAVAGPIEEILGLVLAETGYQKQLRESEDEDDQQRLANIEELLTVARDFDERQGEAGQLEAFLEETSLVNDTDAWETDADRVTLMTLHASKGLEFPVVYLTAVEEGILPHERSREHPEQLEEERRLMFVGITRAQQELQLSTARYRDFRGQRKLTIPSSFLMELPRGEMDVDWAGVADRSSEPEARGRGAGDACDDDFGETRTYVSQEDESVAPPVRVPRPISLTTAAAMADGGEPAAPPAPDAFRQGMLVLHEEYGLGQMIALSGSGQNRKATVDFASPAGRKKFLWPKARCGRSEHRRCKTLRQPTMTNSRPNKTAPTFSMIARALAHRNYRLFFFGQGVSLIGTWMQQTALTWLTYRLTDSAFLLGTVAFAGQISAFVTSPLTGVLADRWNRHRTVVVTQTLSMIHAVLMTVLVMTGVITFWQIIALTVVIGLINALDMPARQALVVDMIEDRADLGNAIALNSMIFHSARLVGPAAAGLLIWAFGEWPCFLLNAISYLAVLAALLAMRIAPRSSEASPSQLLHGVREGVAYANRSMPIRTILALVAMVGLVGTPLGVLMPVYADKVFGGGSETYGLLMSVSGLGALAGCLFLAMRKSVLGLGRMMVLMIALLGVATIGVACTHVWRSRSFW